MVVTPLSGVAVEGENIHRFEQAFCRYLGGRYGIGTNLGRSAIELTLRGLGLGEGDEVILPTSACRGIIEPVLRTGCRPRLVDVDSNFNISPESMAAALCNRTRAIIVVHTSGKFARLTDIRELIKGRDISIVEDACQATGGREQGHGGRYWGILGDVGIFSFGMGKNMMATAGGIVVTDCESLYRSMRHFVMPTDEALNVVRRAIDCTLRCRFRRYTAPFLLLWNSWTSKLRARGSGGYRLARLANLDAAVLQVQMHKLPEIIKQRRANAQILIEQLSDIENLLVPSFEDDHIFTKFIVTLRRANEPGQVGRCQELEDFRRYLLRLGVETEYTYIPLHLQEGFMDYAQTPLPVAEDLYWRSISLPVQPHLNAEDMHYVASSVRRYFSHPFGQI